MNDKKTDDIITLIAVGDISFHGALQNEVSNPVVRQALEAIKKEFQDSDIVFGNMECVLGDAGTRSNKLSVLLTSDSAWAPVLKDMGFNIFNMANNHIMDMGLDGLLNTMNVLDKNNLSYIGVGRDINEAIQMKVIKVADHKIGFLAFAQDDEDCVATSKRAGGAPLKEKLILELIKQNKPKVDYLIVTLHMGIELIDYPSPQQMRLFRHIIDYGANIVLGHHPHVPQGYEKYKQGLIIYSLGNFIFDMLGGAPPQTQMGYIYKILITRQNIQVRETLPYKLNEYCIPYILQGSERERLLNLLTDLSKQLSNPVFIRLYWFKMSRWYVLNLAKGIYYQIKKKKRYKAPFVFFKLLFNPESRYVLFSGLKSFFYLSSFGSIDRFKWN